MSREIPYQPIREPRKEVSQQDMLNILEKHSKRLSKGVMPDAAAGSRSTAEPPHVEAGVASAENTLRWNKPDRGATGVRTACGRYSCSKVTVNGKTTYEAWKLIPDASWFKPLAVGLDSFETAKRVVDEDFKRSLVPPTSSSQPKETSHVHDCESKTA